MPYVVPTVTEFKTRFPIFSDKDDPIVQAVISEASNMVDKSWKEYDYQPAIMYLAAHLLATDNSDEGSSVQVGAAGGRTIASESFGGGLSRSYTNSSFSQEGSLSADDQFGTTEYGRRYYALLKRNRFGPFAI